MDTAHMTIRRLDPTVARAKLGAKLREIREGLAVKLATAAGRVGRPHSWLSRVERGESRILPGELEVLLGFYRSDTQVSADLMALAGQAGPTRRSPMYRQFSDVIEDDFDPLLRIEASSSMIRTWECQVVPALLQIRDYARAVIAAGVQRTSDAEIDSRTGLRLSRQQILTSATRPVVTCVIAEGVLMQHVGGADVMRNQLDYLIAAADDCRAVTRILPFSAGAHSALNGPFVLATMPPLPAFAADGPEVVAYQDTVLGCVYHRQAEEVGVYEDIWSDLVERALSPEESVAALHRIRAQIHSSA